MGKQTEKKKTSSTLRNKAEARLRKQAGKTLREMSTDDSHSFIHELQVHQIELEMQNEELRTAQEALEDSRSRYSDLYDFAPIGYFTFNKDGLILEANITGAEQLGIERSSLIKKPFSRFIQKDDADIYYLHRQEVMKSEKRKTCEVRMKRSDKTEFYAQLVSTAIMDESGNTLIRSAVMNISDRMKLKEELMIKQRLNKLLIDSLPHTAMLIRKDRTIIAANKMAEEAGAIVGGNCWQEFGKCQFISEEHKIYIDKHNKIPDGHTQCYFCNADEALKSRSRVNIEVNAWDRIWDTYWVPLDEETYLHYAIDITDRKKADDELQRHREQLMEMVDERTSELRKINEELEIEIAERTRVEAESIHTSHLVALGELAAGVAHEINNPINGIINYAQMLANKSSQGSREHDVARRVVKEGDRIANIVNSLLSFSRAVNTVKERIHILDIMSESLALTQAQIRNDGININIDIPESIPTIFGQLQQIEQVFLNIISNARHALNQKYPGADKNKILNITAKEVSVHKQSYVQISFYDSGHGIQAKLLDKIMNPFFTSKPRGVGTGLGLSISHGIIKDHDGRIMVDSVEGEYTKILIELPACR